MIRAVVLLAAVVALLQPPPAAAADGALTWTDDERALILSHGPWPPKIAPDPSNRVSGDDDAIAFGRALFESATLSRDRNASCATCHNPGLAFSDGLKRGVAIAEVDRNTPSLFNMRLNRWYGWGGKSDSLWAQSIPPFLDQRELALPPERLRDRIAADAELAAGYRRTFGREVADVAPEAAMVDVAKALAAFQETLVSPRTAFDDFRDALAANDSDGMAAYPAAAQRGLKMFIGRGQCVFCHFGPNFTNGEFGNIGLGHFMSPGRVDKGRYGGIELLRENPFNLLGDYNDDPDRTTAGFTRLVRQSQKTWGEFRVPSLRNVAHTAPYMHDGSLATLEDVVHHYSEIDENRLHQDGEKILKRLDLTDREVADMVTFLKTL